MTKKSVPITATHCNAKRHYSAQVFYEDDERVLYHWWDDNEDTGKVLNMCQKPGNFYKEWKVV